MAAVSQPFADGKIGKCGKFKILNELRFYFQVDTESVVRSFVHSLRARVQPTLDSSA